MDFKRNGKSVPAPVGSAYCIPTVTQFEMTSEFCGHLTTICDAQGNIVFNKNKEIIRNASNELFASVKRQLFSLRGKWKAYNGNTLLFTLVRSAFFQRKASYNIFLLGNHSSSLDFLVQKDRSNHNFVVSYGDAKIAEVQEKERRNSLFDQYDILIQPGIDYAFILLIAMIIIKMKKPRREVVGGHNSK